METRGMLKPDHLRNSSFTDAPTFYCDLPNLRRSRESLAGADSCMEENSEFKTRGEGNNPGSFLCASLHLSNPRFILYYSDKFNQARDCQILVNSGGVYTFPSVAKWSSLRFRVTKGRHSPD